MQTPTKWKHNFSAGPSAVDAGVLAKLSAELASFEDTGMVSVDVACARGSRSSPDPVRGANLGPAVRP